MKKNILKKIWDNKILICLALWIGVWGTYNIDYKIFINPNFPNGFLDILHGVRIFLPFLSLLFAIILLIKNRKKVWLANKITPLGIMAIYAIVGIIASALSLNTIASLYWGILYFTAIIVLFVCQIFPDKIKNISFIIRLNWIIAGLISVGMLIVFFTQPGIFSISTLSEFLQGKRPFESMGGVLAESQILGMAGTRPTGLGRYAGVIAIALFANFWQKSKKQKIIFGSLFFLFSAILFFSRSRTAIIAFILSIFCIAFLKNKNKIKFIFVLFTIAFLLFPTNFYNFSKAYFFSENLFGNNNVNYAYDSFSLVTLSGRSSGIWPLVWNLFLMSPIIGCGFHADRIFLNGLHTHNAWLQALVQSGILGTLFFIMAFLISWIILTKGIKKQKDKIILWEVYGVLIFFLVRSITESFAYFGADYLFLIPIIAFSQFFSEEKKIARREDFIFCGIKISALKMPEVLEKISYWVKNEKTKAHWIVATGMHGIVEAYKSLEFKNIIRSANLFVPDGISLVWLAQLKGRDIKKRVSGPDLMKETIALSEKEGFSHFFYGDTNETLQALREKYPNIKIVGMYSPSADEVENSDKNIEIINNARPDILWVGLGLPKQENWIYNHKDKLNVPVVIGVGAAFKFLSGKTKRAPKWVGDLGFEWLWRLFYEPKRIWKRVFIDGPIFVWLAINEFWKLGFNVIVNQLRKISYFLEDVFLRPMGKIYGPKLLEQLIPYNVKDFEEKIRIGNPYDGGYVIPKEILSLIDVEYCYGVATYVDFEEDLLRRIDIPMRLYDHTIDGVLKNKNFFFKQEGIAASKRGRLNTFENHLKENNDQNRKILLKIDIEGAEWNVLPDIIEKQSENIVAIVLELHRLYRYEKIKKYVEILKKINSKFTLVHIHCNNNGKLVDFGKAKLTNAIELTFINNNLVKEKKIMEECLPSKEDCPNIRGKSDVIIDFWKK